MLLKLLSRTFRVGLSQGCCVNKKKLLIWVQKEGVESKVCLYLRAGAPSFERMQPCMRAQGVAYKASAKLIP